jgi:hypothetical protein
MRIDEYEFFPPGRAKALMDEAGFTTPPWSSELAGSTL